MGEGKMPLEQRAHVVGARVIGADDQLVHARRR
jgi:hypothetical protein